MAAGSSSWSSSSSCASSLGFFDDEVIRVVKPDAAASAEGSVKFLCSYGGRILPRPSDGALRYAGGDNRVLSVDRSLQFYELQRKMTELCGWEAVCVRCQLPTEDLDALVSVTSDDDLANLLEEYDAASRDRLQPLKIRAFLFPRTSATTTPPVSPSTPSSVARSVPFAHQHHHHHQHQHHVARQAPSWAHAHQISPTARVPPLLHYHRHGAGGEARPHRRLVHNGRHWQ